MTHLSCLARCLFLTVAVFLSGSLYAQTIPLPFPPPSGGSEDPPSSGGDNQLPICDAGMDIEVDSIGDSAFVVLFGNAFDPDGDRLSVTWSVPPDSAAMILFPGNLATFGIFPVGETVATLTVSDGRGGEASDTVTIKVNGAPVDPPEVLASTSSPLLWPPNHGMKEVIIEATAFSPSVPTSDMIAIFRVTSSEPDSVEVGDPAGDVNGVDGYSNAAIFNMAFDEEIGAFVLPLQLRAERSGNGPGRTYEITCEVMDPFGNVGTDTTSVFVPHDQGKAKGKKK